MKWHRLLERASGVAIAGLAGGLAAAIAARVAMRVVAIIEGMQPGFTLSHDDSAGTEDAACWDRQSDCFARRSANRLPGPRFIQGILFGALGPSPQPTGAVSKSSSAGKP